MTADRATRVALEELEERGDLTRVEASTVRRILRGPPRFHRVVVRGAAGLMAMAAFGFLYVGLVRIPQTAPHVRAAVLQSAVVLALALGFGAAFAWAVVRSQRQMRGVLLNGRRAADFTLLGSLVRIGELEPWASASAAVVVAVSAAVSGWCAQLAERLEMNSFPGIYRVFYFLFLASFFSALCLLLLLWLGRRYSALIRRLSPEGEDGSGPSAE